MRGMVVGEGGRSSGVLLYIYYAIYALRPLQERYRGGMPEKFIRRRVNGFYHQCETVVRCVAGTRLIEANHLQ